MDKIPPHKEINIDTWIRKTSYNHFSSFSNPTYGFNCKIDITDVYNYSKETNTSIFINFLYLLTFSLNEIPAFRIRIFNKKIVEYEKINPAFTIMTKTGQFENCSTEFIKDYKVFYKNAFKVIEDTKNEDKIKDTYNDSIYFDRFYITCIPWLEINSMNHPIPDKDKECMSVPRICWDKFHFENNRVTTNLNITVSHALMDGKHLSDGFNNLIKHLNNIREIFNIN